MGAIADAMVDYARPLLDATDGSEEQLNKAFAITHLCWNLALSPKESRDATLGKMRPALGMGDDDFDDFRQSVIIPMVRRHEEMFPKLHRRVPTDAPQSDFSPHMHMKPAVRAERSAVIDRYAPCPCNSGRKYKFCCGRRGSSNRDEIR